MKLYHGTTEEYADNYMEISGYSSINEVCKGKVKKLIQSMLKDGWNEEPILYCDLGLITGSHRLVALQKIEKMYSNDKLTLDESFVLDEVFAINVMEEINNLSLIHI